MKILNFFLSVPLILGLSLAAHANDEEQSSPYLDQIELRSVASLPGGAIFSLHDRENDRTFWIGLGEVIHGLEAVEFDAQGDRLTIRHGDAVRQLSISRSRVQRTPEPAPEPEALTPAQRREQWMEMRERMIAFRERWEAAAEDSPEIRAIENRMQELGGEMRDVMMRSMRAEQGSVEQRRLTQRRNQLQQQFQALGERSRAVIENHPGFEPEDVELMDNMQRLMPPAAVTPQGGGGPGGGQWGGQGGGQWGGQGGGQGGGGFRRGQ